VLASTDPNGSEPDGSGPDAQSKFARPAASLGLRPSAEQSKAGATVPAGLGAIPRPVPRPAHPGAPALSGPVLPPARTAPVPAGPARPSAAPAATGSASTGSASTGSASTGRSGVAPAAAPAAAPSAPFPVAPAAGSALVSPTARPVASAASVMAPRAPAPAFAVVPASFPDEDDHVPTWGERLRTLSPALVTLGIGSIGALVFLIMAMTSHTTPVAVLLSAGVVVTLAFAADTLIASVATWRAAVWDEDPGRALLLAILAGGSAVVCAGALGATTVLLMLLNGF